MPAGSRRSETKLFDQLGFLRLGFARGGALAADEDQLVGLLVHRDADDAALGERAEQQFLGERLFDVLLDDPAERARTEQWVVALLGQPIAGRRIELDHDVAVGQLLLKLQYKLV